MLMQNPPKIEVLDALYYQTFGFLVLRHFFDPRLIAAEIDQVMRNGPRSSFEVTRGEEIHFQYVPMMTAETPGSLWLLDRTETVASNLVWWPCPSDSGQGDSVLGRYIMAHRFRSSDRESRRRYLLGISSRKEWCAPCIARFTSRGVRHHTPRIRSRRSARREAASPRP
jgi:hypothetical protein